MSEHESSMHPDLAKALRAYEIEVLDGTERSQKAAYETLRLTRRRLGGAAISKTAAEEPPESPEFAEEIAS